MSLSLRNMLLIGVAIAVGAIGPPTAARAKGPVDRISISRLVWEAPVDITSGPMLEQLSPWRDDFLSAKLPGQPDNAGVNMDFGSQVSFYLEAKPDQGSAHDPRVTSDGWRLIYYVDYYPDLDGESPGFIILGRDPRTADLNNGTIIRDTGWYEATPAWQDFMASLPGPISPPSTGGAGLLPAGGGGCHGPLTDGTATRVEIVAGCYGPTIARVEAGDTITWVNHDQAIHNVYSTGQDWGDGSQLLEGASVTAQFDRTGIFPYVCTFHPGMVGVVVVGDGSASAAAYEPPPAAAAGREAANGSDVPATISQDGGSEGKKLALAGLAVGGSMVGLVAAGWLALRR